MILLRGLGGLKTTALILLITSAYHLHANQHCSSPAGMAMADAIITMAQQASTKGSLMVKAEEVAQAVTQEQDADEKTSVDPQTIALATAMLNFALDLFSKVNAWDYVKEQVSLLFNAITQKLPGVFSPAASNS